MSTFRYIAAAAAVAVLAACSGHQSGSMIPAAPLQSGIGDSQSSMVGPDVCSSKGDVRVSPCHVILNGNNPGPVRVTLHTPPGRRGRIVEHDNCSGIATIQKVLFNKWTVSAGANDGSCQARFNYFRSGVEVGHAILRVQNNT